LFPNQEKKTYANHLNSMMKHAFALAILAGLLCSPAAAKPTTRAETDYSALEQVVSAELKEKRTPGAARCCCARPDTS